MPQIEQETLQIQQTIFVFHSIISFYQEDVGYTVFHVVHACSLYIERLCCNSFFLYSMLVRNENKTGWHRQKVCV